MKKIITALIFLSILFLLPKVAFANNEVEEILVKYLPNIPIKAKIRFRRDTSLPFVKRLEKLDIESFKVNREDVRFLVRKLSKDPRVLYAEPNYKAFTQELVNDPGVIQNLQWGLNKVMIAGEGQSGWDIDKGDSQVTVAVLDTGIDQNHEDLKGKIVKNKNCTSSSTVDDLYGHGTHVAGIIAATTNNGIGVAGLGYYTSIINAKSLSDSGSGYYTWIADCIVWAADSGADVINLSLGGSNSSRTLEEAVKYAYDKGVVIIAAAGNLGNSSKFYPAAYNKVISVAATGKNDKKASFSNWGRWVDVAAPGVSIYSTLPNHKNVFRAYNYGYLSGTSMATPHVAGLAALIIDAGKGKVKNYDVENYIKNYTDRISGTGLYFRYGRINAYNSLIATGVKLNEKVPSVPVLTGISKIYSTPVITPSPTPSPTISPSPSPTPTPTIKKPAPSQPPKKTPRSRSPRSRLCSRFSSRCN